MSSAALATAVGVAAVVWLVTAQPARQRVSDLRVRSGRRPRRPRHSTSATAVGALTGLVITRGPVGAVAGGLVAVVAHAWWQRRRAAATAAAVRRALPDVLRLLAAEMHAGAAPADALTAAATAAPPELAAHLGTVAAGAGLGIAVADSMIPPPAGADGLHALAAYWRVSADAGAGLADGVQRLAGGLAAEERCRAELDAQLAGPRASAAVLAGLPVVAMAMAAGLGASPLEFFATPAGTACLLVGGALDAAGLWWTRALATRALR